jgi:hypothetical protein
VTPREREMARLSGSFQTPDSHITIGTRLLPLASASKSELVMSLDDGTNTHEERHAEASSTRRNRAPPSAPLPNERWSEVLMHAGVPLTPRATRSSGEAVGLSFAKRTASRES